jgi:hypothetical protein
MRRDTRFFKVPPKINKVKSITPSAWAARLACCPWKEARALLRGSGFTQRPESDLGFQIHSEEAWTICYLLCCRKLPCNTLTPLPVRPALSFWHLWRNKGAVPGWLCVVMESGHGVLVRQPSLVYIEYRDIV